MNVNRWDSDSALALDAPGDRRGLHADLTPMLDTVFLIMAVLLAAMIHMTAVEGLPTRSDWVSERTVETDPAQRVEVVLPRHGIPIVDGTPTAVEDLPAAVDRVEAERKVDVVFLLAHAELSYGKVADVLLRLQRPGRPPVHLGIAVE